MLTIAIHVVDGLVRDVNLKVGEATGRTTEEAALCVVSFGLPEGHSVIARVILPAAAAEEEDQSEGDEGYYASNL